MLNSVVVKPNAVKPNTNQSSASEVRGALSPVQIQSMAPALLASKALFATSPFTNPAFSKDTFSSSSSSSSSRDGQSPKLNSNAVANLAVASSAALPLFPAFGIAAAALPLVAALAAQLGQQLIQNVDAFMATTQLASRRFSRSVAKLNLKASGTPEKQVLAQRNLFSISA